jgi:hypothetical protein
MKVTMRSYQVFVAVMVTSAVERPIWFRSTKAIMCGLRYMMQIRKRKRV